jgi:hypothetical protein
MNKENCIYSESDRRTQDTQEGLEVIVVGEDFTPGFEAVVEINKMLGKESGVFGGKLMRETNTPEWEESPNWCGDTQACLDELKRVDPNGSDPVVLELVQVVGKKKGNKLAKPAEHLFAAVFEMDGLTHVTEPFPSYSNAVSCVLWFVLSNKSAVT